MKRNLWSWTILISANVLLWGVLSFYRPSSAAPPARQPFANPVQQRNEIVRELQKIGTLLEEQNRLLRAMAKPAKSR